MWLVADGRSSPFDGDLDDYRTLVLENRSGRSSSRATAASVRGGATGQDKRRENAKRREDSAPLRKKIKDAEAAIARLQKDIAGIDTKLADPKLYQRPIDAAFLAEERADAVRSLAVAEEKWLAASAEAEAAE